jgi:hypothetical protein
VEAAGPELGGLTRLELVPQRQSPAFLQGCAGRLESAAVPLLAAVAAREPDGVFPVRLDGSVKGRDSRRLRAMRSGNPWTFAA